MIPLDGYDLVIWALGEEGIDHDTFSAAEQGLVAAYLYDEGSLMERALDLLQ